MATTVVTECAECSTQVRVPATAITLVRSGDVTTYGYQCPRCKAHTIRVPSTETLEALRTAGVRAKVYVPPQRLPADPLTEDDLLRFGRELEAAEHPTAAL